MPQPTAATVLNLSRQVLLGGFFPGGFVDQFVRMFGFQGIFNAGSEIAFNRASTLPTPQPYNAGQTLQGNALATTKLTVDLRRIGDFVKIDWADQVGSTEANDQIVQQWNALRIATIRAVGFQIIEGTNVAPAWNGLKQQATGSQLIGAGNGAPNGAIPTLEDFSKLVNLPRASDGSVGAGADALIGTEKTERQLFRLMYTQGMSIDYKIIPALGVSVLHFKGRPFFIGQVAENETLGTGVGLTSCYAVKLHGETGARVLYAVPAGEQPRPYGINPYVVAIQQNVAELGMGMAVRGGVFVAEPQDIARMQGIDNSNIS